jgi:hypothetical protein
MKKYFRLSAFIFTLTSCIKVETIPAEIPKYAAICILSPTDSLITAFVVRVNRINEEIKSENLIVKNALVKIIGENENANLVYNYTKQQYQFSNNGFVKHNKKYQLIIEIPNEKQLTSECYINDEIEIYHEVNIENDSYKLDLSWEDNPAEDNYYTVSANYFQPDSNQRYMQWNKTSKSYFETNDLVTTNKKITINGFIDNISKLKRPFVLNILLSNIEKNTSDFFISRNKQYNQNSSLQQSIEEFIVQASKNNVQVNDFFERFKEPVILPKSNIENGLGFFGSYYAKTKQIIVN